MTVSRQLLTSMAIVFSFALALNVFYPPMSDDYTFRYIWHGESGNMFFMPSDYPIERIETADDVLFSLRSLYLTWGGRMITWTLAYIFANLPDIFFDLINSAVFVIFIMLIAMIGTQTFAWRDINHKIFLLAALLLFGASPMFANAYLWIAGSVGYLWPLTFQLAFICFYAQDFFQEESAMPSAAKMFPLGVLAGWSNENTGAVSIMTVTVLSFAFWRKGKINSRHITGIVGALLGYLALVAAPGNYARMNVTFGDEWKVDEITHAHDFLDKFIALFVWNLPLLLIYLKLPGLKKRPAYEKTEGKKRFQMAVLFLGAGFVNTLMMVPLFNSALASRSLTGSVMFWLLGVLTILTLDKTLFLSPTTRILGKCYIIFTMITLMLYIYATGFFLYPQDRERDLLASQSAGCDLIVAPYQAPVIPMYIAAVKGWYGYMEKIGNDRTKWPNRLYSDYWHLNSAQREKFYEPQEN